MYNIIYSILIRWDEVEINSTNDKSIPITEQKQQNKTFIKKIDIPILNQGYTNRCGSTSLTMVLNYYQKKEGKPLIELDKVGDKTTGFFTSPKAIVDFARSQGYEARVINYNDGTEEDAQKQLQNLIENDIPVIIKGDIFNYNGNLLNSHYVVVNGFEKNEDGKIKNYLIANPWGCTHLWNPQKLEAFWSKFPLGLSRCMIPIATKDKINLLTPEKPHNFYNIADTIALTETGIKTKINSTGNISGGVFLETQHNLHLNKNLEFNNYFSGYIGADLNKQGADYTLDLKSFVGKVNKSSNWDNENRVGLEAQLHREPGIKYTFSGGIYSIGGEKNNFEYEAELKAGLFNGIMGMGAEAEINYALYKNWTSIGVQEIKLFLEGFKSQLFNGQGGFSRIEAGIKYEF